MGTFKVGDRVRCVNADDSGGLIDGQTYVIINADPPYVELAGIDNFFYPSRFVLDTPALTGSSSPYYGLPLNATDLQDLIEHKKMAFGRANIFKAAYRLGEKSGVSEVYDLEKIVWFAQRRLAELAHG